MQLVRLAGSPFEEEARTSAHLACKLIREHALAVSFEEAPPAPPPPRPHPRQEAREARERQEASRAWGDPGEGNPTLCDARESLRCCSCGILYHPGERIWWLRGVGGCHQRHGGGVLVEAWRMARAYDPRNVR